MSIKQEIQRNRAWFKRIIMGSVGTVHIRNKRYFSELEIKIVEEIQDKLKQLISIHDSTNRNAFGLNSPIVRCRCRKKATIKNIYTGEWLCKKCNESMIP